MPRRHYRNQPANPDGVCCGAFAIDGDTLCCILAKAVVLAAGGASTIFSRNMYPDDISGDGYAMSARANARIANMEFVQIGLGLALPKVTCWVPNCGRHFPS
jgi:L-aspartate oxidase